jgi:hypothetical protein
MPNNQKFPPKQPVELTKSAEFYEDSIKECYDFDSVDISYLVKKSLSQYQPAAHRIMAIKEKLLNRL